MKKLASKVAYFSLIWAGFSTANRPKTSPNFKFCSIKKAHRVTYIYIMNLPEDAATTSGLDPFLAAKSWKLIGGAEALRGLLE